ncbi:MAG: hypothetical protein JWM99_3960 [Verrucomicrobiales bacterium]|nr:hypothetical protein [Verrucomicrobiales bacterium]
MKTIQVPLKEGEYDAAKKLAQEKGTTVAEVLAQYLSELLKAPQSNVENLKADSQRDKERLAALLRDSNLELGFAPSRERTYEGGRFSRF